MKHWPFVIVMTAASLAYGQSAEPPADNATASSPEDAATPEAESPGAETATPKADAPATEDAPPAEAAPTDPTPGDTATGPQKSAAPPTEAAAPTTEASSPEPPIETTPSSEPTAAKAPAPKAAGTKPPAELTWQDLVLPFVGAAAGVIAVAAGIGVGVYGAFPIVQHTFAQQQLLNLEESGGDLEQAQALQAEAYGHQKTFRVFGFPLIVGGAVLALGGLVLVASGTTVGIINLVQE